VLAGTLNCGANRPGWRHGVLPTPPLFIERQWLSCDVSLVLFEEVEAPRLGSSSITIIAPRTTFLSCCVTIKVHKGSERQARLYRNCLGRRPNSNAIGKYNSAAHISSIWLVSQIALQIINLAQAASRTCRGIRCWKFEEERALCIQYDIHAGSLSLIVGWAPTHTTVALVLFVNCNDWPGGRIGKLCLVPAELPQVADASESNYLYKKHCCRGRSFSSRVAPNGFVALAENHWRSGAIAWVLGDLMSRGRAG